MSTSLRLVQPGETRPQSAISADTPVSELTAGQLARLVREASVAPSPYDRLTPEEAWTELRIGKTAYHKLIRGNVLRQLRDEVAGVVFVTRAELDRYKRETGSRPGSIANTPLRRVV